jgi:FkbM family methyltransferase
MRASSVPGKFVQLQSLPWPQWRQFIHGWLLREKTGTVPCVLPCSTRSLQVPLLAFYESYCFFSESKQGRNELRFFLNHLRPGDVIYDIGAFRGAYGVAAKAAFADAVSVHAFEPIEKNLREIEAILRLNQFQRFHTIGRAVGVGTTIRGQFNEKYIMLRRGDSSDGLTVAEVAATSLDAYTQSANELPSVIKVDVDGFELDVLLGARSYLSKHKPRLWIELHPDYLSAQGRSWKDAIEYLNGVGYKTINFYDDYDLPTRNIAFHVWCES